jgi:hypothetical protein
MDTYKVAVSNCKLSAKLLPGDPRWQDFNASFKNMELEPQDLLDVIYNGRAITTHHKNQWRATQNYLCGQHIGLDFDSGDENSRLGHLIGDKFISRYASLIHTTISHTPEHPRARVIFLLDSPICQAKNYALAASALLWLFGTADRQCKDAVRFFYGSPGCEFEYIKQVLPLEIIKKLIASYIETGAGEKHRAARPDYLPPASQQEVAGALKAIDPWKVEYDEWVSILMAIHSQFGEGGYTLAENWADGKQGEVSQKWKSFKQDGNATGAVTIASVFGIAKRFGWKKDIGYGMGEN